METSDQQLVLVGSLFLVAKIQTVQTINSLHTVEEDWEEQLKKTPSTSSLAYGQTINCRGGLQ